MFAGSVDRDQLYRIRIAERATEFVEQIARPCIAVGLKQHMNVAVAAAARGGQGGANLRRMVAVIVYDGDTVHHTLVLEAAVYSGKAGQPGGNRIRCNAKFHRCGNCRSRIAQVVHARHEELKRSNDDATCTDFKVGVAVR